MQLDLKGAKVLVTAGASGIGLAIARAFVAEGANVHVCDVDAAAIGRLEQSDPDLAAAVCDVADRGALAGYVPEVLARLGGLDVLVNNAGIAGPTGAVEAIEPAEWERTFAVNITGAFNVTRLAVPALKASANASIVNLASAAGKFGFPFRSAYAASKWAVVGFTKSLARELGPHGIRVNAILPGSVDGPRIQAVFAEKARVRGTDAAAIQAEALALTSLGSLIPPTHLANTAVFLASPAAATISGQAISVDGDAQTIV